MPTTWTRPLVRLAMALAFLFLMPTMAAANWVGGVSFSHYSPGYLPHYQDLMVTVDYKVSDPGGARIYVMPMTDGAPTPDSQVSTSSFVPMGEGTTKRMFRVNSGLVTVDQVRIRMTTHDDTAIILDYFVESAFHFSPYGITNIQFGKSEYSAMARGEDLNIGFEVASPGPDNILVIAMPYFNGSLVPGADVNEAFPIQPRAFSHQHFDFPDTDADINQVRFTMTTADGLTTLLEFDRDVRYFWREFGLSDLVFSEPSPSSLHHSQNVLASFDYNNPTEGDIVFEIQPYQGGSPAAGGEYETGTVIPPGTGSSSRYFGSTGTTNIDQVRLVGTDTGGATTFLDILVPVSYAFAPHALNDLVTEPGPTAVLDFDEDLVCGFNYHTDHAGGVRIQAVPFSGGVPNLDFLATPSVLYPTGSGVGNAGFRLLDSSAVLEVDEVRIRIFNEDFTQVLNDVTIEADYFWRGTGWASAVPRSGAGIGTLGQNHPNPFNPTTAIPLVMTAPGHVRLSVYDLRGRLVKTLADRTMAAGPHTIFFDGHGLASGAYHYRLEAGGTTLTRKMTLLK